jgi:hypothetical protein
LNFRKAQDPPALVVGRPKDKALAYDGSQTVSEQRRRKRVLKKFLVFTCLAFDSPLYAARRMTTEDILGARSWAGHDSCSWSESITQRQHFEQSPAFNGSQCPANLN